MFQSIVRMLSDIFSDKREEVRVVLLAAIEKAVKSALKDHEGESSKSGFESCRYYVYNDVLLNKDINQDPVKMLEALCKQGHFNAGNTYISPSPSFNTRFLYELAINLTKYCKDGSEIRKDLNQKKDEFFAVAKTLYLEFLESICELHETPIDRDWIREDPKFSSVVIGNAIAHFLQENPKRFHEILLESAQSALTTFKGFGLFSLISQNHLDRVSNVEGTIDKIAKETIKDRQGVIELAYEGGWDSSSFNTNFLIELSTNIVTEELALRCLTDIKNKTERNQRLASNVQAICQEFEARSGKIQIIKEQKNDLILFGSFASQDIKKLPIIDREDEKEDYVEDYEKDEKEKLVRQDPKEIFKERSLSGSIHEDRISNDK